MRATKQQMEKLHAIICAQLTKLIEDGGWTDEEGKWVMLPAAYFTAAISFLNQNDMKGIALDAEKGLGKLANQPNLRAILEQLQPVGQA